MARPKLNNADYFQHYTSMRNHRKVKALKTKFGALKGYAFWCMMLEWLTERDGLEWEYSKFECEMFAADLGVSAAEIIEMVDYCIEIELLFITETNFVYSTSLNDYLSPLFEKRKRERERSELRKKREEQLKKNAIPLIPDAEKVVSEAETNISVADIPQSRVEKSRVNKSRVEIGEKSPKLTQSEIEKFNAFSSWMKVNAPEVSKMREPLSAKQFIELLRCHELPIIQHICQKMNNRTDLGKNRSAFSTIEFWLKNEKGYSPNKDDSFGFTKTENREKVMNEVLLGDRPDLCEKYPGKSPREIANLEVP